jgi:hypothetical protein
MGDCREKMTPPALRNPSILPDHEQQILEVVKNPTQEDRSRTLCPACTGLFPGTGHVSLNINKDKRLRKKKQTKFSLTVAALEAFFPHGSGGAR